MEKWGYLVYTYDVNNTFFHGTIHVPDCTALDFSTAQTVIKADQLARLIQFAKTAQVNVTEIRHNTDYIQRRAVGVIDAYCELHNGNEFFETTAVRISNERAPLLDIQRAASSWYIANVQKRYGPTPPGQILQSIITIGPFTLVRGNLYAEAYAALLALAICCKRAGVPRDVFRACIGPHVWHSRLEQGVWLLPEEAQRITSVKRSKKRK